jgi:hypothetical protein
MNLDQFFRKMDLYSSLRAEEMFRQNKRFKIYHLFSNPLSMFIKIFILKRGFLDGTVGLMISVLYAYYTLVKYAKLWEKIEKTKETD